MEFREMELQVTDSDDLRLVGELHLEMGELGMWPCLGLGPGTALALRLLFLRLGQPVSGRNSRRP